jgi:hypothetical protein
MVTCILESEGTVGSLRIITNITSSVTRSSYANIEIVPVMGTYRHTIDRITTLDIDRDDEG